jgi:hypothetical protein
MAPSRDASVSLPQMFKTTHRSEDRSEDFKVTAVAPVPVLITSKEQSFPSNEPHAEPQRARADSFRSQVSYPEATMDKIQMSSLIRISGQNHSALPLTTSFEKDSIVSLETESDDEKRSPHFSEQSRLHPSWFQRFCLHWLTAYRVLIALTFIINLIVLAILIGPHPPLSRILIAAATNILVAVLVRQEDLINLSFSLIAKLPPSLPLSLRKTFADLHHYGGVHIGCAISTLLWYCYFIALNTRECIHIFRAGSMTRWHWVDIITCYIFLLFIFLVCLTAIPRLRERLHNSFERMHRFGGWAALTILWINSGLHTKIDTDTPLETSPSLWLLAVTTFFIILPWLRIRRVAVSARIISSREVKLSFPYRNMPYTSTARFSLAPVMEWHAFATVPAPDGKTADIIISAAGDWTKNIMAHPPEKIWIRTPAAANFLAFAPVFNSLLLVATGAGIGPMLSLLSSPAIRKMRDEGKQVRVMWCVFDPNALHWAFVQKVIRDVDPLPKIFDSRNGRPDMAFEARVMAQVSGIEAVMVVSNPKVTNEVVREVKAHGGAAYGAVFDS